MTHPIPQPRRSGGSRHRSFPSLPPRPPLAGPSCPSNTRHRPTREPLTPPPPPAPPCIHVSCRQRRAQGLPRLGGHRSEYAAEHARAADAQARNPHLVVWFGESTGSFWVASSTGLAEVPDLQALARFLGSGADHGAIQRRGSSRE